MTTGEISRRCARKPDHLGYTKGLLEEALHLALAHAGISIVLAGPIRDEGTGAVELQVSSFRDQLIALARIPHDIGDPARYGVIIVPGGVLSAPAVEDPILDDTLAIDGEPDRSVVAHPCRIVRHDVPVSVVQWHAVGEQEVLGLIPGRGASDDDIDEFVLLEHIDDSAEVGTVRGLESLRPLHPDADMRFPFRGNPSDLVCRPFRGT